MPIIHLISEPTLNYSVCHSYYIEFLDEALRSGKDNILQENLFIVLTSVEMVALCRVMAVLHFKICMPMRWLAGNTHFLGRTGFDWSSRSMGKAIDSLYSACLELQQNGELYLNEEFMNAIFDNIYVDSTGNPAPLLPLQEAMTYQYEERQTVAIDGSKVLPYDQLNAEMFYPVRPENQQTSDLVKKMAIEVADCILKELCDPKKALSDYLSCKEGKFSWGETSDEVHEACLGRMATNDFAESPFAGLTQQMQQFGRVLGIHASAVSHAKFSGDFCLDYKDSTNDGRYFKLPKDMRESLLTYALSIAPTVRKEEKEALELQREAKKQKQKVLLEKQMLACKKEYADALTYIEIAHSPAFWSTKTVAKTQFKKLTSNSAKLNAVKEQIRIRVLGFGWNDLHHPWSKDGVAYTPQQLLDYLVDVILPEEKKRGLPDKPEMNLPSRKYLPQLGEKTADVDVLEMKYEMEKDKAIEEAIQLREDWEGQGLTDRHEKLQPPRPEVDAKLVDKEMEILFAYKEPDGSINMMWCQGTVMAVKKNSKVHIKWDISTLREGDKAITEETLLKSKYNKHVLGGWRYSLD